MDRLDRPRLPPRSSAAWAVALASLGLHLLPRPGWGFHRDELLYLAMADHLDPLRMQFPPAIALLGSLAQAIPVPTLVGVRLVAAVAAFLIVLAAVEVARRMGGGPHAQILCGLAFLLSPLFMRTGALFQPVVFEQLWWALAALGFVAALAGEDRRWWLVLGAAAGLGGLTKFSAAFFGVALAAGALVSPLRRDLRTRWPWIAILLGALIALPSVLGQITWGWPFFEQARILRESQLARVTPGAFLGGQLLEAFGAAPLLVLGLFGLLFSRRLRPFRPVGVAAVTAALLLMAGHGKSYYFGPMQPALLAGGAVLAGEWLAPRPRWWSATLGLASLSALATLPMGIPVIPPASMARYSSSLGVTQAVTTNTGSVLTLPQDYADMLGWREQVAAVARVYHALPEGERARTVIVGGNYGRAGALAAYRGDFGLPYPVSRHGDFHAWGPGLRDPAVVVILGGTVPELQEVFEEVVDGGAVLNPMGVPEEQEVHIHICRRPRQPFPELWERLGVVWG